MGFSRPRFSAQNVAVTVPGQRLPTIASEPRIAAYRDRLRQRERQQQQAIENAQRQQQLQMQAERLLGEEKLRQQQLDIQQKSQKRLQEQQDASLRATKERQDARQKLLKELISQKRTEDALRFAATNDPPKTSRELEQENQDRLMEEAFRQNQLKEWEQQRQQRAFERKEAGEDAEVRRQQRGILIEQRQQQLERNETIRAEAQRREDAGDTEGARRLRINRKLPSPGEIQQQDALAARDRIAEAIRKRERPTEADIYEATGKLPRDEEEIKKDEMERLRRAAIESAIRQRRPGLIKPMLKLLRGALDMQSVGATGFVQTPDGAVAMYSDDEMKQVTEAVQQTITDKTPAPMVQRVLQDVVRLEPLTGTETSQLPMLPDGTLVSAVAKEILQRLNTDLSSGVPRTELVERLTATLGEFRKRRRAIIREFGAPVIEGLVELGIGQEKAEKAAHTVANAELRMLGSIIGEVIRGVQEPGGWSKYLSSKPGLQLGWAGLGFVEGLYPPEVQENELSRKPDTGQSVHRSIGQFAGATVRTVGIPALVTLAGATWPVSAIVGVGAYLLPKIYKGVSQSATE